MVTRSMFPITKEQIARPRQVRDSAEFKQLIPESEHTGYFLDAFSHMRDHIAADRFVVALIWADGHWCLLYDIDSKWVRIHPGLIQEAYRAAQRGEHIFPCEDRSRLSVSCGRTGS